MTLRNIILKNPTHKDLFRRDKEFTHYGLTGSEMCNRAHPFPSHSAKLDLRKRGMNSEELLFTSHIHSRTVSTPPPSLAGKS